MISVVIPLYNKAASVEATLRALAAQTFRDFELIVVDDGSTDSGPEIVRNFLASSQVPPLDTHNSTLITQKNAGVSAARNAGIHAARGQYVALLDADDLWKPTHLQTLHDLTLKYPQAQVFATNYQFQDARAQVTPTIIRNLPFQTEDGILSNYFQVAATSHPPIWSSAVMARKQALEAIGGFPIGIKSGEDLLTWARLAARFTIAYSTHPTSIYNLDPLNFNEDQKKRFPEQKDIVGIELEKLASENPNINMDPYIALWHKIRARTFIEKRYRWRALKECQKSMRFKVTPKILAFSLICFLPYSLSGKIFQSK